MAKAVARKEYSVNLTVLPWLRIATGSLIMPAFACISLSRRTAMSTATGRLSRAGSLNVSASWRIAHLLAVKYATVNTAESETRTVIPRFMFVLGHRLWGTRFQASELCGPLSLRYVTAKGRLKLLINRLTIVRRTLVPMHNQGIRAVRPHCGTAQIKVWFRSWVKAW